MRPRRVSGITSQVALSSSPENTDVKHTIYMTAENNRQNIDKQSTNRTSAFTEGKKKQADNNDNSKLHEAWFPCTAHGSGSADEWKSFDSSKRLVGRCEL